jgi:hypothetical protein
MGLIMTAVIKVPTRILSWVPLAVFCMCICCFATGSSSPLPGEDRLDVRWLASSNPVKDFELAKQHNDIYLIGFKGITLTVPGAGGGYFSVEVRVVKGTSDFKENEDHLQIMDKAIAYARKYNELVLSFLAEKKKKD